MAWWGYTLIGIGLILISWLFYANRDSPSVSFEGGTPGCVTALFTVIGAFLIIISIWGSVNPRVLEWMELYTTTADNAENAWEVLGFLFWQIVLVTGIVYILFFDDDKDALPFLLFFLVISVCYWIFVITTGRLERWIIAPFRYFYDLIVN